MPQILTIPVLRPLPLFVKGGNPLIPPFSKGGYERICLVGRRYFAPWRSEARADSETKQSQRDECETELMNRG